MDYPPKNPNFRRKRIKRKRLCSIYNKKQVENYYKVPLSRAAWTEILSTVYNHIKILEQSGQSITNHDLFMAMDENI